MNNECERTPKIDKFWADVRIQPVQLALPSGVGYTLRTYRMSDELPDSAINEAGTSDEADEADGLVTRVEGADPMHRHIIRREDRIDADAADEDELDELTADGERGDESEPTAEAAPPVVEELPLFLARRGKLLLFRTVEGLAAYLTSSTAHDLAMLPEWGEVEKKVDAAKIVPTEDDSYELDLVVENLRGGYDAWDPELLISAGEIARDLSQALGLRSVQAALAPGSPLDDFDEALRGVATGGIGAFLVRRKVKKFGTEQTALAWRTVIGKISAATDWRD